MASAGAGGESQALLLEFPAGSVRSCPAELCFRGKVELPF